MQDILVECGKISIYKYNNSIVHFRYYFLNYGKTLLRIIFKTTGSNETAVIIKHLHEYFLLKIQSFGRL